MSTFKHWFTHVGVPMIKGVVYGFILAHVILLPLLIFTSIPYLPMSILIGNFVGTGIVGIFMSFDFFRNRLPAIREREAKRGFITKEM
jgi:hypothetical protein